ncbi:RNA polymerase sigma factor [Sulfitobacter albidus]|uniref:RNA polymerase sigma factor n=1 Tax=Sulfitobacter albidus TaxID=2829501 RepID=UPI0020C9129F|nr:RNA polymerase sigma factor [Sulfitobacter albidus]
MLTRNRADAADLAQTTCERALRAADSYTPGTALDRWIMTIARRTWLNDIRAGKVRRGAGLVAVEDIALADEKPHADVNIFAAQVLNMVEALPEGQREVIYLVSVEGYSYRETADLLDIPIGTVMSRLSTARAKLAAQLTDEGQ